MDNAAPLVEAALAALFDLFEHLLYKTQAFMLCCRKTRDSSVTSLAKLHQPVGVTGRTVISLKDRRNFLRKAAGGLATVLAAAGGTRTGALLPESGAQVREIRESTPKLRIGVFDAAFHDLSTEQLVELIKELKIEAVEIGSGNDPGAAHCDRELLLADDAKRRAYAALFESNGILISAFSCHGNPVHPDREKAQREDGVYRQSIDLAAKMGVNRVVCFSGCPGDGTGKHPNWITSLETDEFVDILKWQWNEVLVPYWKDLASYARQRNVKLAIEMDLGYSVFNVATLVKLRHAAGDNVGANLDPSGLWHLGVEPTSVVKKLGEEGCITTCRVRTSWWIATMWPSTACSTPHPIRMSSIAPGPMRISGSATIS